LELCARRGSQRKGGETRESKGHKVALAEKPQNGGYEGKGAAEKFPFGTSKKAVRGSTTSTRGTHLIRKVPGT